MSSMEIGFSFPESGLWIWFPVSSGYLTSSLQNDAGRV